MKKLLLIFSAAVLASAQVPDSVMKVLGKEHDTAGNWVARIQNTGSKTITAWEIKPGLTWRTDQAIWAEGHLEPGLVQIGPSSWTTMADDGSIPEIIAVVFQDGTSVGDSNAIDDIFGRRQGIADEFGRWHTVPADWTRERFTAEFKRAWPVESYLVPVRSSYQAGISIAVSEIRFTLERPEIRTMSDVRQFLAKRMRESQIATRRAK